MLRDVNVSGPSVVNVDALKSEVRQALINQKANACPMAVRVAWHSSGTFDSQTSTGGSDGATIRFEPESADPANAGLSIIRDLLLPVKQAHPEISFADLHTIAGCMAVEFLGGPKVPFNFGRTDAPDGGRCPGNGRLPDAAQGADHLRKVFAERMGFTDREIVALSGGHTLGRAHRVRSGFDGPWTSHPLRFDNEYYTNLLHKTWEPRKWDGPLQYEDKETHSLMMLPTDIALLNDAKFKAVVEEYAKDQDVFFKDFALAFAKLMSVGCPNHCQPGTLANQLTQAQEVNAEFREHCMHGSLLAAQAIAPKANVHEVEPTSGRSALHKAAFWGHVHMIPYLVNDLKLNLNVQDHYGDTPLHDAAKFGHPGVAKILVDAGADQTIKNNAGKDAHALAVEHQKPAVISLLTKN